jgi:hypothetical protein
MYVHSLRNRLFYQHVFFSWNSGHAFGFKDTKRNDIRPSGGKEKNFKLEEWLIEEQTSGYTAA